MADITAATKVTEEVVETTEEVFILELDAVEAAALTRLLGEGPHFNGVSPELAEAIEENLKTGGLYFRLARAIETRLDVGWYADVIPELEGL